MDICRLCAVKITDSTSVFSCRQGKSLAEMVQLVSSVEIKENDRLSSCVCPDCVELTVDAFEFVNRVREVDEHLRRSLREVDKTEQSDNDDYQMKSEETVQATDVGAVIQSDIDESSSSEIDDLVSLDQISIEYLEDEPDATSEKQISLVIESVDDIDSEKSCRIKQDSQKSFILNEDLAKTSDEDDFDENGSSAESDDCDVSGQEDNVIKIKGIEQAVRCCSRNCRLVFKTRDDLVKHGSEVHSQDKFSAKVQDSFECVICFQRFETRKKLSCHLRRLVRDYRCHFCKIYFDTPRDRYNHMKSNHSNMTKSLRSYRLEDQPLKICCGCESTFETIEELYQHGADEHQNQQTFSDIDQGYQCNICYKFFKSKASLRNHQILVYKPKTFSCSICGRAFECPSKLSNHQSTHRTERNFACSVCGGTYKTATDLRGHQRIHQDKRLVCNVCGARFHKKSHLRSHLKTHDVNTYEFSCSMCPRKFKEKSNWKSHLKVHTREKPYKCEYCPKEFRYTTDRKRHEMTHTGNYPHNCSLCGKAFARGNQLKAHGMVCDKMREK